MEVWERLSEPSLYGLEVVDGRDSPITTGGVHNFDDPQPYEPPRNGAVGANRSISVTVPVLHERVRGFGGALVAVVLGALPLACSVDSRDQTVVTDDQQPGRSGGASSRPAADGADPSGAPEVPGTHDAGDEAGEAPMRPCRPGEVDCPGSSCDALLQGGVTASGVYWVNPPGAAPFQIFCDMQTDGGGWELVWKNHGGARGGKRSNEAVLAQTGEDFILPHTDELASQKHQQAYDIYRSLPGIEWAKMSTLWSAAAPATVVASNTVRLTLPDNVTWDAFFEKRADTDESCVELPGVVKFHVDGEPIGSTSFLFRLRPDVCFGFANTVDRCGQSEDNLVSPLSTRLYDVEDGTIRSLLSYAHTAAGRDASRCHFACWDTTILASTLTHFDGFTWAVRRRSPVSL
jgi:hypothetical protein